ncbi:head decoration protein [Pseudoalteromonas spongiae]|uniref:head decoration protein n=1 Tax=Pseudoalteromonas spongiae TaxID=298657 RepID=UPI000C2D3667|nr:head decoration protein [Pseudoalteromonas spongiae]
MEQVFEHEQIAAGERVMTQNTGTFAASQTLEKLAPVGRVSASGELKAWDPAANDGTEKAIALTVGAVDTTSGARTAPFYDGGHFNNALIAWPVAATAAQKAAAFDGTPIATGSVE